MNNFRISIQDKVRAYDNDKLVGITSMEKIEDFCIKNSIDMPKIWNENDKITIEIVKSYFEDNINDNI